MSRWYLIVLLPLALWGCAKQERCQSPQEKFLGKELMLLLASARSYHHQADIYLQQGEVEQAIRAVSAILDLQLDPRWPEAEEVRLDATARLSKLLLGQGKVKQALEAVDQGIRKAVRESFYLSNLHGVRGEILEQQSKELDQQGDKAGARNVARDAIAAFETSIAINKRLQRKLLQAKER